MKQNRITINADTSELYNIREAVKAFIGRGLPRQETSKIVLALDEALANIVIHGYKRDSSGLITIEMVSDRSEFRFIISDNAPSFNALNHPEPDIDEYLDSGSSGGLGVAIYKKSMEVHYEKNENGGNRLILVKQRNKK